MKIKQEQVCNSLREAIALLCRDGLDFDSEICVEGLLGITTDKNDIFLVNIKEVIRPESDSEEEMQVKEELALSLPPLPQESASTQCASSPSGSKGSGEGHESPVPVGHVASAGRRTLHKHRSQAKRRAPAPQPVVEHYDSDPEDLSMPVVEQESPRPLSQSSVHSSTPSHDHYPAMQPALDLSNHASPSPIPLEPKPEPKEPPEAPRPLDFLFPAGLLPHAHSFTGLAPPDHSFLQASMNPNLSLPYVMSHPPPPMTSSLNHKPLMPSHAHPESDPGGEDSATRYRIQQQTSRANKLGWKCSNCGTSMTTMWRRNDDGEPVCNPCGLYYKLHKVTRPLSLCKPQIRFRRRKPKGERSMQIIMPEPESGLGIQ